MRRGIAPIAVALALLAGCGQEHKRTIPVGDVVAALDQTREARSERIGMKMDMKANGQTVHMTGDGIMDNRTREGRFTLDMSDLSKLSGGQLGPGSGKAEEIVEGTTFWMRWAPLTKELAPGKEWLKMDMQELGRKQGFDFDALSGVQGDPTSQLDQLRAVRGDVEVVGNETVRGVPCTHYRATVDLRRYPDVAAPQDRERVRKSVDRLIELTGESEIPTEIWVGHDTRRIHRTRFRSKVKVPQGGKLEMDMTMDLYDFGVPVTGIEPPPANQVADAAELPGVGAAP
jgi:hypothetical protein